MFLTIYKLESHLEAVDELRYDGMQSIFPLDAADDIRDKDTVVGYPPQKGEAFQVKKNDFLVGRDRYLWLEKEITVPQTREGFDTIGYFDLGDTCEGFSDGFESVLYVNGKAWQGVDSYHNEVFFPEDMAGKKAALQMMVWSGLEGGGEPRDQIMPVRRADIGYLHRTTDEFYFLAHAVCQTWHILQDTDPLKNQLLHAVDSAMSLLDLDAPKEVFYQQVEVAHKQLTEELAEMHKTHDVTIYCVGHSHIDVAWLWRVKHTKEKCLRSFSTVMRLMDRFDDYRFIQSQPQLYRFVKDNYPVLYDEIRQRVAEGKFEPNGGMWGEADCNLISGEAMVRQFLYGDRFFREEFGKRSNCLWLPDVFGYSWAMPQVLKQCGIDTFMTTKISWNEYNKIPHDTFMWKGMDGTEILTHFVTVPNEDNPEYYSYFTYNGFVEPVYVHGTWNNYKDKGLNQDLLMAFGYGDGGGGPTRQMLMKRRAIDQIPGMPHVKTITAGEYFEKLHQNVENTTGYLHTWDDELYFENHRGTYTSQAYNKRMNRRMEGKMQVLEAMAVLAARKGAAVEQDATRSIWETIMINQFHDIIPGSSISEVYADCHKDYTRIAQQAQEMTVRYASHLIGKEENWYSVWNASVFEREDMVLVPESRDGYFEEENGARLSAQKTAEGWMVRVPVLGFAFASFRFVPAENVQNSLPFSVNLTEKTVETPFYVVKFGPSGEMISLFDKQNNREVLKEHGNRLIAYMDRPVMFDAWNIDYDHYTRFEIVDDLQSFELEYEGGISCVLRLCWKYNKSTITQRIVFYADNRRIDFDTKADWHEQHRLLKADFSVDIHAHRATYDIQFGNLERNTHHSTSWDWAKFEVCAHKWIDLSEHGYGVALLNNCKYGHSVCNGHMAISLIKCATWPAPDADQGEHAFMYSLLPHAGGWREAGVHQQGEWINQPLTAMAGRASETNKRLIWVNSDAVSVDAIKPAEDGNGFIVRMHEYQGGHARVRIGSDYAAMQLTPVNMLEETMGDTCNADDFETTMRPYQICNYRVQWGN